VHSILLSGPVLLSPPPRKWLDALHCFCPRTLRIIVTPLDVSFVRDFPLGIANETVPKIIIKDTKNYF